MLVKAVVRHPASRCLPSLSLSSLPFHLYALHLQPYRNHVKEISVNLKDPAIIDLAVLKKTIKFSRFQNGSINLLSITSKESWFLIS